MAKLPLLKHLPVKGKFLVGCILIASLGLPDLALARYNPPSRPSAPTRRTGSTTSRGGGGCAQAAKASLTPLAPVSHVGQTVSTHPTFSWFVPDNTSYPVEFILSEVGATGQLKRIQTIKTQTSPGFMPLTLPKDEPGLETGKTYHWKVVVLCNPNRPSMSQTAEALVEVVETPASLRAALAQTNDRAKRADLYAEAGFWYDALAEVLTEKTAKGTTIALLEQLVQIESSSNAKENTEQGERLRQVIAIVQNQ